MKRGTLAVTAVLALAAALAALPVAGGAQPNPEVRQLIPPSDRELPAPDTRPVDMEVRIIRASNEGKGIDRDLDDLKDRLSTLKFDSYELVSTRKLKLEPSVDGSVDLPNGKVFRVRNPHVEGDRAHMTVDVADVVVKVSLLSGGTIMLGGLGREAQGELILAVSAKF